MTSKTSDSNIRPAVVVASASTSKESSPASNDKRSKKSKHGSKSSSRDREEKSRKHKKKHHQSKKSTNERRDHNDDAPPLPPPPDETIPPPPLPPLPLSNSHDDIEESSTTNGSAVKTNLPLSHSPPPVMPNILRQGSRSRLIAMEQLVPSPVIETNGNTKSSPTSTTNMNHMEDLATKKFEEQLALLDATSSKLTMNNWEQSSEGSEEDEQIERICRMNNTGSISGPIQFKFNRTQHLPLKASAVSNDVANNEEEPEPVVMSTRKKRLHKPNDPTTGSHSSLSGDENEKASQSKKQKTSENESTEPVTTDEQPIAPVTTDENEKSEAIKGEEPVASTTNEKKSEENGDGNNRNHDSRSSSVSSRSRRHSSHRRHRNRRRRRHSSSSSSRSSYTSTSSDSSRSSYSRSHRRRRRRRSRSSRSSSRSSTSSSDNRSRQSSRSSRRSSRSYSRRRSSSSRSSRSSTSSRSSKSRSRSRSHNRKSARRSNNNHQIQSNNNGKGRGGAARRGRGARNGPRGRRAPSNDNLRRSPPTNRNGNKYNGPLGGAGAGIRKLPNNKQPRVLIAATPKVANSEENSDETAATSTTEVASEGNKMEPIILTTNQIQQRCVAQKKNVKGKNKQQTPAYSLKKEDNEDMEQEDGEPIIGPKLPPEFEKKITKDHSFTPPDMDDPDNIEMLNDLKYRAEIHAAKNHGLITEIQAQQLIEERETQRQLADLPLIHMPIMPTPAIQPMPSFIVAAPNPVLANYHHLQVASAAAPQITTNSDTSSITLEQQHHQQQQQLQLQQQQLQQQQSQIQSQTSVSPNSAASSGGESCSTPGQTTPNGTTTVLTQDGQPMMIQAATNGSQQLVQIAQPTQQLYMPMQTAVQQPRVVAVRTPQGGLQHFIEYPTAQLLQTQQQQQPQFIQHNGQLVQVIRPQVAYSAPTFMQQLQLQQQQQQVMAAQFQAQQLAAMQQTGGAVLMQNSAGQLVLAQPNPQAMRVVQIPYVPK